MKKFLGIILTICLMTVMLCVAVFALDAPASDTVLRVSALKRDGSEPVFIADYKNHAEGWSAAMTLADNKDEMNSKDYDRVVVDIYADWIAENNGVFCKKGKGFDWGTIYFERNVRMTVNLNGHTINRGLEDWTSDGEVMYINNGADVIINDGTIMGGFSCNGAGGIHICDNANVTLNNVNVVKNSVEDDDGAGIAVYDGATLTMNGGSISDNKSEKGGHERLYSAGLYIEDSTAFLNGVIIQNNQTSNNVSFLGAAVFMNDSDVTMKDCKVIGNGSVDPKEKFDGSCSVIHVENDSNFYAQNTEFSGNGSFDKYSRSVYVIFEESIPSSVLFVEDSEAVLEKCSFTNNSSIYLLYMYDGKLNISDSFFTDNNSNVFGGECASGDNRITGSVFNHNTGDEQYPYNFRLVDSKENLTFADCDFGDSTFDDKKNLKMENVGSIFGEGSLSMIVAITALIASVASIGVSVVLNKKKTDPSRTADGDDE